MPYPSKVDVWEAELRGASGHEQKGSRPVLLWRDLDHVKIAIVIPLTSNLERKSIPHTYLIAATIKNGLQKESIALIFQIRAIDKVQLKRKVGELESHDIAAIADVLKDMLKLNR
ncbi:type II toxin-antitoxin system PemK/MazF family toxin [Candidatus Micrarchaeota archaeon]|nr:type II toxin-antitoxin system PemK/MazF family toxin [Candidatus Micrarchaeota archaeon]